MPEPSQKTAKEMDNEKIEILLKLVDFALRNMERRMSYAWKCYFGLWTALAIISWYAIGLGDKFPMRNEWLVESIILSIWLLYFYSMRCLFLADVDDNKLMTHYLDKVSSEVKLNSIDKVNGSTFEACMLWSSYNRVSLNREDLKPFTQFWEDYWLFLKCNITQIFVTTILLLFTGYALTNSLWLVICVTFLLIVFIVFCYVVRPKKADTK